MRLILSLILSMTSTATVVCQPVKLQLSLNDALILGREQSISSKENKNTFRISYWQYRNHRADLYPGVMLNATLPSLNRFLTPYQQEDGIYKFISNNHIRESLGLTVSQAIPFTGGSVYLQTNVERIDQLNRYGNGSFLTIPFNITLVQPVFAFNNLKWAKRIEPVTYEKSKRTFVASIENVNMMTVNYYFNLLLSMVNRDIACQNRQNAAELYRIALAKNNIGTISENEIMQLEVGVLNSNAIVIAAEHDYSEKMHALRNYLGYDDSVEIVPEVPPEKKMPHMDPQKIKDKSYENNPAYQDFKVRILEAEANMEKAKREHGPDVQLYISAGATGSDYNFFDSYGNLRNRQIVEVGISIPILDWGKRKGQVELAKSRYALLGDQIVREQNDFDEKVKSVIDHLKTQPEMVDLYGNADSIAQKRYKIAFEKFTFGNMNIIDIHYAQQEKDNAKRNYIDQLYLSWLYYYSLRYLTLYDFEKDIDIGFEYDDKY